MADQQEYFLSSEEETIALGARAAKFLKTSDIVKISGELGAGKTTFVRGVVRGLGGDENCVHSPTFSLVHEYECPTISINHCDFYRLAEANELEDLGGAEFFSEPKIYLIEWLDRINVKKILGSKSFISVHLQLDASGRKIIFPKSWSILD